MCHIDATHRNDKWDRLRGDIPNGVLKTEKRKEVMVNSNPVYST
jgi:hypothetical protein